MSHALTTAEAQRMIRRGLMGFRLDAEPEISPARRAYNRERSRRLRAAHVAAGRTTRGTTRRPPGRLKNPEALRRYKAEWARQKRAQERTMAA